jgi:hypothetical protein
MHKCIPVWLNSSAKGGDGVVRCGGSIQYFLSDLSFLESLKVGVMLLLLRNNMSKESNLITSARTIRSVRIITITLCGGVLYSTNRLKCKRRLIWLA